MDDFSQSSTVLPKQMQSITHWTANTYHCDRKQATFRTTRCLMKRRAPFLLSNIQPPIHLASTSNDLANAQNEPFIAPSPLIYASFRTFLASTCFGMLSLKKKRGKSKPGSANSMQMFALARDKWLEWNGTRPQDWRQKWQTRFFPGSSLSTPHMRS